MEVSDEKRRHQLSLEGLTMRVEDVERSLDFYMKLPGVEIITHREGVFALIQIGAGRLGLLQMPSAPLFHLEFETTGNLDTLAQQFQAAGMEYVKKPAQKSWGEVDFTVRDPDGNLLEFDTTGQVKAWEE
ncbi:MAG: VOC family protein [Ktedonobacteraceae bacterium]|nr:VOC family protein [Ktedonobacteraceae bacterium]